MKMKAHILLVGRSRDLHKKCHDLGIKTTLMVEMSKVLSSKLAPHYHRVFVLPDAAETEEWVKTAIHLNEIEPFTGVGAFTEIHEKEAVLIAKQLNLPCHSEEVIRLTHEKEQLRKALKEKGLDQTPSLRLKQGFSDQQVYEAIQSIGFPVVLKPANARASLAVYKIKAADELEVSLKNFRKTASKYDLLIEKMLVGREFSVEGFSEKGIHKIMTVTEKFKDEKTSIETGHVIPARVSDKDYLEIKSFTLKVLDVIGVKNGPTHTELFLTEQGPQVVESHVRLGGDRIADLIEYVTGYDVVGAWVKQVAGHSVLSEVPEVGIDWKGPWASVQYRLPHKSGKINDVIEKDFSTEKKIKEVSALLKKGEEIDALARDSFSRSVESIALGDAPEEAIWLAQRALDFVKYEVQE